jgi:hypothetical protein
VLVYRLDRQQKGVGCNAWKRQPEKVDLAGRGGHRVRSQGLDMYPEVFKMMAQEEDTSTV